MTAPSEDWSGFTDIPPKSEKYGLVKTVLDSANFQHLKKCAVDARYKDQTDLPPDINCSIDLDRFATGYENLVFEVAFSDGIRWIARIPYRTVNSHTKTSLLSEIATMNLVRQRTTIPVPRIYGFEVKTDDPFGYPYVLMEYMSGHKLNNGLARTLPQYQAKVAKQLANVFAELQNLTFSRIGRIWCGDTLDQPVTIIPMAVWHHSPGPLETSLEYFYNQRQGQNRLIMDLYPDDADQLTACWVLKSALTRTIVEDRVRGPFPLCHLDFHHRNLLFDDEYNLTGVIDWSRAQAAPLEQLSFCPNLVNISGRSDERSRQIVEFKKLVINFIREKEKEKEEEKEHLETQSGGQKQEIVEQTLGFTSLSAYMASESPEIMFHQSIASPKGSLWAAKRVSKLMYGEYITWEQLKKVYGYLPLY
ncbi:hypothetical protein yc1106_07763 [Curvularia clavata]|uniref:Aminoglycoside phosphotransferase domain-containing protein n=1 Tax=Curvularia clavata TaxID=95742 RepID=A0A9Q8ZD95_CURCL|nr:hypothetical protein yc1106_07763 [Curvularia clavata]